VSTTPLEETLTIEEEEEEEVVRKYFVSSI